MTELDSAEYAALETALFLQATTAVSHPSARK